MTRKQTPIVLTLAILLLALVASGCATAAKVPGQVELTASTFDSGTISNSAPVSRTFQVRNVGRGALEIAGVSTSCGCTTAEIGNRRVTPGGVADLTVTFDPQAHGGAAGAFVRQVYVRSDDPDTPEATLTIRVTVVEP